jgi:thioredoxin 2
MAETVRVRCPKCGIFNRLPLDRIQAGERPVCGRCKAPLPVEDKPIEVTDATFAAEVEQASAPVLLDLWAPWCGPCRAQAPVIDQLAAELTGRVRFAKINIDENPRTATRLGVSSIPTLLVFKGGREVDRLVGLQTKASLAARLQRFG